MGFTSDNLIFTSHSMHILPDGALVGVGARVSASHQTSSITVTANTDNLHAPIAGTSSFMIVSASGPATTLQEIEAGFAGVEHNVMLYWTSHGANHISRIKTTGNSSSVDSGYGSLGGSSFIHHFPSSSRDGQEVIPHPAYSQSIEVWYSNPSEFTFSTSSIVTVTSLSGSQPPAPSGGQYAFFISGSGGQVFKFIPTASTAITIETHNRQSGSLRNFEYLFQVIQAPNTASYFLSASVSGSNTVSGEEDGIDDGPLITSISQSLLRLADVINTDKHIIGVSATQSGDTIQFTATESGHFEPALSFITQSLEDHTDLATFAIGGGQDLTSSRPPYTTTFQAQIPLPLSASAFDVAMSSSIILTERSGALFNTTVSGAADTFYGLIITNKHSGSVPFASGSSSPAFTYEVLQSGSFTTEPTGAQYANSAIPIHIENNDSVATMVTKSVDAINQFFIPRIAGGLSAILTASFSGSTHFQIEHVMPSFAEPPVAFEIARGMSASIVTSGSDIVNSVEGQVHESASRATFKLDPADGESFLLSGSGVQKLYMSGSGTKIGFNTTDPKKELDIRADEVQFQKRASQRGLLINEFGDIESFNFDAASAATGSELIMSYQAGGAGVLSPDQTAEAVTLVFPGIDPTTVSEVIIDSFGSSAQEYLENTFRPEDQAEILDAARKLGFFGQANVGDVIGSVRWVVNSGSSDSAIDRRSAGEACNIKSLVTGVNNTDGGVTSKLQFNVAKLTADTPLTLMTLDPQRGIVASSSIILTAQEKLIIGGSAVDGADRQIKFQHSTAPFVLGVDDSRDVFAIHGSSIFNNSGTNDFEISAAGSATFKYSVFVTNQLHVSAYTRTDALRVGTTSTSPANGDVFIEGNITNVGHITASSNISASGFISASSFIGDGSGLTNVTATATIPAGTISSSLQNLGNITGSNISASGTIIADAITATLAAGTDNSVVVLNSSNQLVTDEARSEIFGSDALITAGNANETLAGVELGEVTVGIATTAKTQRSTTNSEFVPVIVDSVNATATAESLKTPTTGFTFNPSSNITTIATLANVNTTHVTASGNISSSSDIIANRLILDQGDQSNPSLIFGTDTDTGIFRAGNDILSFQVGGGNVEMSLLGSTNTISTNSHLSVGTAALTRHVTASGDISASGDVTANDYHNVQHILRAMSYYVNDNPMIQNSIYFGSSVGHQIGNWSDPQAIGGDPNTTTAFDISDDDQNWGMILPFNTTRIQIQNAARPGAGVGDNFTAALYTASRAEGNVTTITLGLATASSTTFDGGGKYTNLDIDYTPATPIPAGTMLYFGVGTNTSSPSAKNARGYHTILITKE